MSDYTVYLGILGAVVTRETDKAKIDDFPFRLQYKVATAIAFLSCVLYSAAELVGENISCIANGEVTDGLSENFGAYANFFCWITGLYLTPESYGATSNDKVKMDTVDGEKLDCIFTKGIGWHAEVDANKKCIKRVSYYQWIPYVLLLQGMMLYAPRIFWAHQEEGKLEQMTKGVREARKKLREIDEGKRNAIERNCVENVMNYINMKKGGHWQYGVSYVIAQVMLILNILLVFWFNDKVLDGHFLKLGSNWIAAPNGNMSYNEIYDNKIPSRDKMNKEELLFQIFPRRAECTVHWTGSAGGKNTVNHYCILGANSLAQYIFLFLWFWYALLLAIHVLNLVRIILMIQRFGRIRNIFLMSVVGSTKLDKHLENERSTLSEQVKRLNYGQYLFLYLVALNTSNRFGMSLLEELRVRGAPDWGKTKGQKRRDDNRRRPHDESELPSYNSPSGSFLDLSNEGVKQRRVHSPQSEEKSRFLGNFPELKTTREEVERESEPRKGTEFKKVTESHSKAKSDWSSSDDEHEKPVKLSHSRSKTVKTPVGFVSAKAPSTKKTEK